MSVGLQGKRQRQRQVERQRKRRSARSAVIAGSSAVRNAPISGRNIQSAYWSARLV